MSLRNLSRALTGSPVPLPPPSPAEPVVNPGTIITYNNRSQSMRQWSKITGLSEATIRYRHLKGWAPGEVLGYVARPVRDRSVEQTGRQRVKVKIVDHSGSQIPRRHAAQQLGIETRSLIRRLRRLGQKQGIASITLDELRTGSRPRGEKRRE